MTAAVRARDDLQGVFVPVIDSSLEERRLKRAGSRARSGLGYE